MDDVIGRGWRLIVAGGARPLAVAAGPPALTVHTLAELDEDEGVLATWFDRHRCTAALVRPDHYVFGTAASAAGVPALLAEAAAAMR